MPLRGEVDALAGSLGFTGVVRVDVDGAPALEAAYGLADRARGLVNSVDRRYAMASGSKLFTALVVMHLVERGVMRLDAPARDWLGDDLPLIHHDVTVEHLLSHRSGIGDYLDESTMSDANDETLTVAPQRLVSTDDYLRVLDGHPMKRSPGTRFEYCNGAFVVLALLAERASGDRFHHLVHDVVCGPAGASATGYPRSDEPSRDMAIGYLDDGPRTNVFHLPVRGNGDGGAYTTVDDMRAVWDAWFGGRIVGPDTLAEMIRPREPSTDGPLQYGLGCWIDPTSGAVSVHGFDAGVGFVSERSRDGRTIHTVCCNRTRGAWPMSQGVARLLPRLVAPH